METIATINPYDTISYTYTFGSAVYIAGLAVIAYVLAVFGK